MSFYNGILNHDDNHESSQGGKRGLPGIGYKLTSDGDYDIQNKKLTNVKLGDADNDVMVKNQIEGYVSNKTKYIDDINPGQVKSNKAVIYSNTGSIHSNSLYLKDQYGQETIFHNEDQDDNQIRLYIPNLKNNDSFGGRLKSSIMVTSINQTIPGKKIFHDIEVPNPTIDGNACNKAYVDNEISKISDASDNSDYVRKSGDTMSGTLNMNNNRITNLPSPHLSTEPATKDYVTTVMNHLPSLFVDRQGKSKMLGNLNMNNHLIQNVKDPDNTDDCANKKYVDISIKKSLINPSHIPNNTLKYIMDDIDQTSSEYGVEIDKIDAYDFSYHSYNKRVIYLKLIKDGNDYHARIGYNIYKLVDHEKNRFFTSVVEWLTTDNNVWNKMEIFNNITAGSIVSNHTQKFEDGKGLYYTRSIVQFEVFSITTPPLFLFSTIHIQNVNPSYPAKFSEMYNVIYGCRGKLDQIEPGVYDKHNAFVIEQSKMKMLVPIDLNNKGFLNGPKTADIYIFGLVNDNGYFTTSHASDIIINIGPFFLNSVILYTSNKYRSQQDTMAIDTGKTARYPINYSDRPGYTSIVINKFFDKISTIKMSIAKNIPFRLIYRVFY